MRAAAETLTACWTHDALAGVQVATQPPLSAGSMARQQAQRDAGMTPHRAHMIGNGIEGQVGDDLRNETKHQDDVLDQVDLALDNVKRNAQVRLCTVPQPSELTQAPAGETCTVRAARACDDGRYQFCASYRHSWCRSCMRTQAAARTGLLNMLQVRLDHDRVNACPYANRERAMQAINHTLAQQDQQVDSVQRQTQHTHDRVKELRRHKMLRNT